MKTVNIGPVDGEQLAVQVEDNATINDALKAAGLTVSRQQSISSFSNAQDVGLTENVSDGETYLITSNHTSGM